MVGCPSVHDSCMSYRLHVVYVTHLQEVSSSSRHRALHLPGVEVNLLCQDRLPHLLPQPTPPPKTQHAHTTPALHSYCCHHSMHRSVLHQKTPMGIGSMGACLLQGDVLHGVPEGEGAGEELIQEHAHTPQVCLGPILLHDDFRRHVHWRAAA